ncbi:ureidoglycolate hydrolase [Aspergillus sclerotioniger CBS 115572]|uniref:Ureidoglycolate hydrolase n=1 Tax=Aspergillus sclerotioniger CBS 115572 TaxID=1450535 RepID=A0A317VHD4_9EURO|nr:ureidoglycolate hydrolase [Aspergillus sclerotioniger CBS 115572]PWY72448.1 ureidoglycolate hydrolase [Aspergillus sclerotioniger CBS 115572]
MPPPTLPTTPTLNLTPTPLTREAFSPFGAAITSPLARDITNPPPPSTLQTLTPVPILANQSSALKYSPISPMTNTYSSSPSNQPSSALMTMFSCFPRKLRSLPKEKKNVFDVRILERHPYTTQTFTPIDLSSRSTAGGEEEPVYLVIVAPSVKGTTVMARTDAGEEVGVVDPPDLSRLRAFVATGGQAVTYAAGTWHAPMVVVGSRRVDFVVVQFVNGVDGEDCQEVVFGEGIVVEVEGGSGSGKGGGWQSFRGEGLCGV